MPKCERDTDARPRRAWLHPLPGGAARYKRTLDAVLAWIDRERPPASALGDALGQKQAAPACLGLLEATGLGRRCDGALELTDEGRAYAADPDPERLFDRLHAAYAGLLETLVLADTWGIGRAERRRLFAALTAMDDAPSRAGRTRGLRAPIAALHRRRWLVSLGLLDRGGAAHAITPLGRQVLGTHAAAAAEIRRRIEDLLENEREADLAFVDAMEDLRLDDDALPEAPPVARSVARVDRVALTAEKIAPHIAHLDLPAGLVEPIAAALSSGKHLLLAGPPGTGKTEIALALGEAARAEGYGRGMLTVTASSEWTTYETMGGYAMERDGSLRFRAGVFLRAIEDEQWLLVDELNRADADRAFGELYTVLAGRGASTPYRLADGRAVSVGPEALATYRVRPSFRLVATMNTWDRGSLFRLSSALLRRFAVVHVGAPDDATYARILDRHALAEASGEAPLDAASLASMRRLFRRSGLLARCPVGPAIAIDMIRYLRQRPCADALAEAASMVLLPQLDGVATTDAIEVAAVLDAEIARSASASALEAMRSQLRDAFPDADLESALASRSQRRSRLA